MKEPQTVTRVRALYGAPMNRRAAFTTLGTVALLPLLGACTPAPMPVAQSKTDPSNPSAPEGITAVVPPPPPTPAAPPATAGHAGHEHGGTGVAADAGVVVYVCPMHPEVTSSSPGVCPKCNMNLVPKK